MWNQINAQSNWHRKKPTTSHSQKGRLSLVHPYPAPLSTKAIRRGGGSELIKGVQRRKERSHVLVSSLFECQRNGQAISGKRVTGGGVNLTGRGYSLGAIPWLRALAQEPKNWELVAGIKDRDK